MHEKTVGLADAAIQSPWLAFHSREQTKPKSQWNKACSFNNNSEPPLPSWVDSFQQLPGQPVKFLMLGSFSTTLFCIDSITTEARVLEVISKRYSLWTDGCSNSVH